MLWSRYALSAAGVVPRLAHVRLVLIGIRRIYLLRGLIGLALAVTALGDRGAAFWFWRSAICLGSGTLYLVRTWQSCSQLSRHAA
jgi:hypothetical protein